MNMEAISITESKRLQELERIIENGQEAWLSVGLALTEIRDSKLYRSDFGTFKEYCQSKWGWTDKRAYQLCAAAEESSTTGRHFSTEREARQARHERKAPAPKPISPPATSFESQPVTHSGLVDGDEDGQPESTGTAGGESISDPPRIQTADEELAEPQKPNWTERDFALEIEGLMDRALFQLRTVKAMDGVIFCLDVAKQQAIKHKKELVK